MSDMSDMGLMLQGYRMVPDQSAGFDGLAARLVYQKKDRELAALLEEHSRKDAREPLVSFFTGELHLLRGNAMQAEPFFAAAKARETPQTQWRFRQGLFRVRIQLGKTVAAYQEVEPGT